MILNKNFNMSLFNSKYRYLSINQYIKNSVANRIRTCAGFPSRFLVCRLNHSAIATMSIVQVETIINTFLFSYLAFIAFFHFDSKINIQQ